MNWQGMIDLAREQTPVFWVAVAALSLGLTLLVAAAVQKGRDLRRQGIPDSIPKALAPEPPKKVAYPEIARVIAAYEAEATPTHHVSPEDGSAAVLLRRLQHAGDRLEEIAARLEDFDTIESVSGLKSDAQDVDYVFRASGS